eukprot:GHVL01011642.1.p1 GENE.GHVL01011642.1~~GHVL01011642.1.p1  ORF type:complete len:195 (+),score=29.80 GHVL01011642.1:81-665(+)
MVFKLQFLLFTLFLVLVNTHNLRTIEKSLTTPGEEQAQWNDGSKENKILLFIKVWESVFYPDKQHLVMIDRNLNLEENDRNLNLEENDIQKTIAMVVIKKEPQIYLEIYQSTLENLICSFKEYGLTISDELPEKDKWMISVLDKKNNDEKIKLLEFTYGSLKSTDYEYRNHDTHQTFNMGDVVTRLLAVVYVSF